MGVAGGRNEAVYQEKDFRRAEVDDHVAALSQLAARASHNEADPPICTLLLRSAKSPPAQALTEMLDTLANAGVVAKAILCNVEPEQDLHAFLVALAALLPDNDLKAHIRWVRNPRLFDAHEQAVYGQETCWTGDAVRRGSHRRNRLALFDATPEALLRGSRAFKALWEASDPVPAHLLDLSAPEGAVELDGGAEDPSVAVAPRSPEGWPLLRN